MKVTRNRSVPVVAALAALGISVAAVSCKGSAPKSDTKPADKTSGPAVAKGDKTVEKPGSKPGTTTPTTAQPGTTKPATTTPQPGTTTTTTPPQPQPTGKTPAKPSEAPKVAQGEPIPPPRPGAPLP